MSLILGPGNEYSLYWEDFEADGAHQPQSISCGHIFCTQYIYHACLLLYFLFNLFSYLYRCILNMSTTTVQTPPKFPLCRSNLGAPRRIFIRSVHTAPASTGDVPIPVQARERLTLIDLYSEEILAKERELMEKQIEKLRLASELKLVRLTTDYLDRKLVLLDTMKHLARLVNTTSKFTAHRRRYQPSTITIITAFLSIIAVLLFADTLRVLMLGDGQEFVVGSHHWGSFFSGKASSMCFQWSSW